jgi:hypothetical protein
MSDDAQEHEPAPTEQELDDQRELHRLLALYLAAQKTLSAPPTTSLEKHRAEKFVRFFSLATAQLARWSIPSTELIAHVVACRAAHREGRSGPTLHATWDLDGADELLIKSISFVYSVGAHMHQARRVTWTRAGVDEREEDHEEGMSVDAVLRRQTFFFLDAACLSVLDQVHACDGGEDEPPRVARLLTAKKPGELAKVVRHAYELDGDGCPHLSPSCAPLRDLELELASLWLRMHDSELLERVYGLCTPPRVRRRPRLLTEREVLMRLAVETHAGAPGPRARLAERVSVFLPDGSPSASDEATPALSRIQVDEDNEHSILGVPPLALRAQKLTSEQRVRRYLEFKREGCLFFSALVRYDSIGAARDALYWLRRARLVLGEIEETALPGAVPAALAHELARDQRWDAQKPPESYLPGDVQRSVEACMRGSIQASDTTIVVAAVELARGLGLSLFDRRQRPKTTAEMRAEILRQLELEFGARARLREYHAKQLELVLERPAGT